MAYAPFHYPPGYGEFTALMVMHRSMIESGKISETERLKYPVRDALERRGAATLREWIGVFCEMGTKHANEDLHTEVIASIQRLEHAADHAARSEQERRGTTVPTPARSG